MRWLGLRLRILLAVGGVTAAACLTLTYSVTEWAERQHQDQLSVRVQEITERDVDLIAAAVEKNPKATRFGELDIPAPMGGSELRTEGVAIPLLSSTATVDLSLADQYSFINSEDALTRMPQCFQPKNGEVMAADSSPGQLVTWTERCGDYVMGYGLWVSQKHGGTYGWLVVRALSPDGTYNPTPALRQTLLNYSALIIAAALVLAAALAAMVARPLTKTREMAEAVASGDLSVRIPVTGRDEVARLSAAVNTMADRLTGQIEELETSAQAQRRFVSDVAHELRTPTAALLATAESLTNPNTRDAAAALVAPQLRRLTALTEDLLEISRMDAARAEVVATPIDLMDLIAEVIAESGAPEDVGASGPARLQIQTDPARLKVVLRNLVANALQHGAAPVRLGVAADGDAVSVQVSDAGAPVPNELRDRIFDRFVRGDQSRHGTSSGLGLAIAQQNAELLGGTLQLRPDAKTFALTLPKHLR